MTGNKLKIIAMVTMIIDHIGAFVIGASQNHLLYTILRGIGRISFPIFCFLLVEGFLHTKNISKYLVRLLAFAIISEIPFDLAKNASNKLMPTNHVALIKLFSNSQNVFFTLFLGLLLLLILRKIGELYDGYIWLKFSAIAIICVLAYLIKCDYTFYGIIQIWMMYELRERKKERNIFVFLINLVMSQPLGALALVPISAYNGERGNGGKVFQYVMYLVYPVHLMMIYAMMTVNGATNIF